MVITLDEITIDIDNTEFTQQFSKINKGLSPIIIEFIDSNNIGDNVVLFYFAGVLKESLVNSDKNIKEAVMRFLFD